MIPGDEIEVSIWLNGTEPQAMIDHFSRESAPAHLLLEAHHEGYDIQDEIKIEFKPATDDRVPDVPPHIEGPNIRLLVVTATVMFRPNPSHFVNELEPKDLRKLQKITRRAYRRTYPERQLLTDKQANTIINDLGPEVGAAALQSDDVNLERDWKPLH